MKSIVKEGLRESHSRDMSLQLARLKRQLDARLKDLPERDATLRKPFTGSCSDDRESEDRIATIAEVALDAMEHDAYWAVFERINATDRTDVSSFAAALEDFGMVELSGIAAQATRRMRFLDTSRNLSRMKRPSKRMFTGPSRRLVASWPPDADVIEHHTETGHREL
ncbi:hypothetical protein [Agrobacterium burrii]